ncbi:MAG: CHC2 zinc finger domain-containing protein [Roseibacillus sp.]
MITSATYPARREELKERYRIPDAWRDLCFEDSPSKSCRCPWREDRKPSFSVYDDGKAFKDFSSDETGDVISFVMIALGFAFKDAAKWCEERAGMIAFDGDTARPSPLPRIPRQPYQEKPRKELKLPELFKGSDLSVSQLSRGRGLWSYAVKVAIEIGTLRFGKVCGQRCWILLDASSKIAEARRLDGNPFDAVGTLPARKAHTLAGSSKSWPLGLTLAYGTANLDATILLVEGGPDYLAAFDFMAQSKAGNFQPVAILGKSNRIAKEALEVMAGRRVRIFPHTDGMEAAQVWFEQLASVDCRVDGFRFDGLTRKDGKPVSDLNDLLLADEASREEWKGVLPR